jgi:hypothetical protein
MSTAVGLGIDRAQANSSRIHAASSNSGGAPWLRYSAGSAPSPGDHGRWAALAADASGRNSSKAPAGTAGSNSEVMAGIPGTRRIG